MFWKKTTKGQTRCSRDRRDPGLYFTSAIAANKLCLYQAKLTICYCLTQLVRKNMTGYCIPYFCYSFSHFYVEQLRNDKLSIDEDELQEVRGIMGNIALGYRTYLHSYRILP